MRGKRTFIFISLALVGGATFAAAQTVTYKYDDLGRVVGAVQAGMSTSYTYDSADNRTSVVTSASSSSSSSSSSSTGGSTLSCPSFTFHVNPPTNTPVSVGVPIGSGCTDSGGYTITTNPATPYNITINLNQTINVPYTASDGHGGTASATITVSRP
jgi:YD repeat-containing protein